MSRDALRPEPFQFNAFRVDFRARPYQGRVYANPLDPLSALPDELEPYLPVAGVAQHEAEPLGDGACARAAVAAAHGIPPERTPQAWRSGMLTPLDDYDHARIGATIWHGADELAALGLRARLRDPEPPDQPWVAAIGCRAMMAIGAGRVMHAVVFIGDRCVWDPAQFTRERARWCLGDVDAWVALERLDGGATLGTWRQTL